MTSGVVHTERTISSTASTSDDPQFHHAFGPWGALAITALLVAVMLAFFIYGQISPGA